MEQPSPPPAVLTGTIPLGNIPAAIAVGLVRGWRRRRPGWLLGHRRSAIINVGQPNPILIGAPGFNSLERHRLLDSGSGRPHRNLFARERRGQPRSRDLQFVLTTPGPSSTVAQLLRGIGFEPVSGYHVHGRRRLDRRLHHRMHRATTSPRPPSATRPAAPRSSRAA